MRLRDVWTAAGPARWLLLPLPLLAGAGAFAAVTSEVSYTAVAELQAPVSTGINAFWMIEQRLDGLTSVAESDPFAEAVQEAVPSATAGEVDSIVLRTTDSSQLVEVVGRSGDAATAEALAENGATIAGQQLLDQLLLPQRTVVDAVQEELDDSRTQLADTPAPEDDAEPSEEYVVARGRVADLVVDLRRERANLRGLEAFGELIDSGDAVRAGPAERSDPAVGRAQAAAGAAVGGLALAVAVALVVGARRITRPHGRSTAVVTTATQGTAAAPGPAPAAPPAPALPSASQAGEVAPHPERDGRAAQSGDQVTSAS